VDEHDTDAIADPVQIGRKGEEIFDSQFEAMTIVASDPAEHVKQIRRLEKLGATAVSVMNVAGGDPLGMLRGYASTSCPRCAASSALAHRR